MNKVIIALFAIFLIVAGFETAGMFFTWLTLTALGHPQEAQQIKEIPTAAENNATQAILGVLPQIDQVRQQAAASQTDPNIKNFINIFFGCVIIIIVFTVWEALTRK